jgi:hypothetical protein
MLQKKLTFYTIHEPTSGTIGRGVCLPGGWGGGGVYQEVGVGNRQNPVLTLTVLFIRSHELFVSRACSLKKYR